MDKSNPRRRVLPRPAQAPERGSRVGKPQHQTCRRAHQGEHGGFQEEKLADLTRRQPYAQEKADLTAPLLNPEYEDEHGEDEGRDDEEEAHPGEKPSKIVGLLHGISGLSAQIATEPTQIPGGQNGAESLPNRRFVQTGDVSRQGDRSQVPKAIGPRILAIDQR